MDVSGGESKGGCCKKQYCIGTWNVRFMTQGKLQVTEISPECSLEGLMLKLDSNTLAS